MPITRTEGFDMTTQTLTVGDIMRRDVVTIGPHESVRKLVRMLSEHQVGGLPVVDRKQNVVGVVSATDVVRLIPEWEREGEAAEGGADTELHRTTGPGGGDVTTDEAAARTGEYEEGTFFRGPEGPLFQLPSVLPRPIPGTLLDRTRVQEIMTPATFSVRPEATLPELARFLLRAGIHRALVFEGSQLVGIATSYDVLRAVAEDA